MNSYELTIVLSGKATEAKKKSAITKVDKLISSLKGKIIKTSDWGKIELSYKIKKEESGIFILFDLELDGPSAKIINEKIRLEDDIIRYLLIRKDK
jgi:small subunit ribosomal protein S6